MAKSKTTVWDAESLQQFRLIRDRRYRRRWGTFCLLSLAVLAILADQFVDFREHTLTFFFAYWATVLVALMGTLFFAFLDLWAIRLEFALQRRELAHEILAATQQAVRSEAEATSESSS